MESPATPSSTAPILPVRNPTDDEALTPLSPHIYGATFGDSTSTCSESSFDREPSCGHGKHDGGHGTGGHGHGGDVEAAAAKTAKRKLITAMIFCFLFMIGEVIGGYFAHSLAIMTDAAHLLTDVAGFLISLFAVWAANRPATAKATFGFARAEVVGAITSVLLIWTLTGVLVYEAIMRSLHTEKVNGKIMLIVATCGLFVNLSMMKILHQGGGHSHGGHSHGDNINVRAAFLHVIGDLIQSIGVMIAAALIWWKPHWSIADPICTFLFSILVLFTTIGILRDALSLLYNESPSHINTEAVHQDLQAIDGVENVHCLHIWSISSSVVSMSVHVVSSRPEVLHTALKIAAKHGISHSTVQVEQIGTSDIISCQHNNHRCKSLSFSTADDSAFTHSSVDPMSPASIQSSGMV